MRAALSPSGVPELWCCFAAVLRLRRAHRQLELKQCASRACLQQRSCRRQGALSAGRKRKHSEKVAQEMEKMGKRASQLAANWIKQQQASLFGRRMSSNKFRLSTCLYVQCTICTALNGQPIGS